MPKYISFNIYILAFVLFLSSNANQGVEQNLLQIGTNIPAYINIYNEDGRSIYYGGTPTEISLPSSTYRIEFYRNGFFKEERTVDLENPVEVLDIVMLEDPRWTKIYNHVQPPYHTFGFNGHWINNDFQFTVFAADHRNSFLYDTSTQFLDISNEPDPPQIPAFIHNDIRYLQEKPMVSISPQGTYAIIGLKHESEIPVTFWLADMLTETLYDLGITQEIPQLNVMGMWSDDGSRFLLTQIPTELYMITISDLLNGASVAPIFTEDRYQYHYVLDTTKELEKVLFSTYAPNSEDGHIYQFDAINNELTLIELKRGGVPGPPARFCNQSAAIIFTTQGLFHYNLIEADATRLASQEELIISAAGILSPGVEFVIVKEDNTIYLEDNTAALWLVDISEYTSSLNCSRNNLEQ